MLFSYLETSHDLVGDGSGKQHSLVASCTAVSQGFCSKLDVCSVWFGGYMMVVALTLPPVEMGNTSIDMGDMGLLPGCIDFGCLIF